MRFELSEKEQQFIETRKKDPDIMDHVPVKDVGGEMSLGIRITDPLKAGYILVNLMNNRDSEMNAGRDLEFEITHICLTPVIDYAKIEPFREELNALIDRHFYNN